MKHGPTRLKPFKRACSDANLPYTTMRDAHFRGELAIVSWGAPGTCGRPKRIQTFRQASANACEVAGYPGLILHDLRRSAMRNIERAGLSRSVAMQLTGHKTESVYRRYAITSESDLREGVARLNSVVGTKHGDSAARQAPMPTQGARFPR